MQWSNPWRSFASMVLFSMARTRRVLSLWLLDLIPGLFLPSWLIIQLLIFRGSIWLNECQAQFFHRHHAQMGENPELRTLFHRLARLLQMCIIPVFVFDGPDRPHQKRGKRVLTKPHWLTDRFKEFVEAFGFYSHMVTFLPNNLMLY